MRKICAQHSILDVDAVDTVFSQTRRFCTLCPFLCLPYVRILVPPVHSIEESLLLSLFISVAVFQSILEHQCRE